ncbi:MAG: hypothetical protein AABW51_03105 [Nanoarchaeota archaeon]
MSKTEVSQADLGIETPFLSYDTLNVVNSIDPQRQFNYAHGGTYIPSATFNNRALMFGIGEESVNAISEELKSKGYNGLVEIKTINPKPGVNKITGRPVVLSKIEKEI